MCPRAFNKHLLSPSSTPGTEDAEGRLLTCGADGASVKGSSLHSFRKSLLRASASRAPL